MNQPPTIESGVSTPQPPSLGGMAAVSGVPWYYGVGQQRVGPVESGSFMALIAAAQVRPETLVWRPGMPGWVAAQQIPELAGALAGAAAARAASPPVQPGYVGVPAQGDATGGLIPYKNGAALASYYVSIASLIPGIGLILAPAAIWLGVSGLRAAKANPMVKGKAHAWVGITLGSIVALVYLAGIVAIVIGLVA